MYVLLAQHKVSSFIFVPCCTMLANKYAIKLDKNFLLRYPPHHYYYHFFHVLPSQNIFDKQMFMQHYKYFYIKAYKSDPNLYPINFVNPQTNIKRTRSQSHEYPFLLMRYLQDAEESVPYELMACYQSTNCIVSVHDDIDVALDNAMRTSRIHRSYLNDFFYICSKKKDTTEIITSVNTNYQHALASTIWSIIKGHEFFIDDDSVHFVTQYKIYKVNTNKNTEPDIHINWYEHIIHLSEILTSINPIEKQNKWYVRAVFDIYEDNAENLPPAFQEELNRLRSELAIKVQDIFVNFKRGSSDIQYADTSQIPCAG